MGELNGFKKQNGGKNDYIIGSNDKDGHGLQGAVGDEVNKRWCSAKSRSSSSDEALSPDSQY
jgi:hypothetical protein